MIKLNNTPYQYKDGMTISSLMAEKGYTFGNIVVIINGMAVNEEKWEKTIINDGDVVSMFHMFAGG
jgi:thiamine biosynthesis protein ThiS